MSHDAITITLEPREVTGKAVKKLRGQGVIPAVIHNHGKDSLVVQGDGQQLLKAYQQAGKHHVVEVTTNGKKYNTMIKVASFEPKKHQLTHLVFNAVASNQTVEAEVPIHPRYAEGNEASPAERAGLLVISNVESVTVKALPAKLPDVLYYDAESLVEVGDHATISDLIVPADVELEADEAQAIATVYEPSAVAAANDAAGGDAEVEDAESVDSEHQSGSEAGTQEDEQRPGGKKEFEDKEQGHHPEKQ